MPDKGSAGPSRWGRVSRACERGLEECVEALKWFAREMCGDPSQCEAPPGRAGLVRRYEWVERIIREGVPDGRSRLILYVVSRYLVNIKGLSPEEAEPIVESFIEASCRNHGNCGKIYRSWVRNVLRHVARGGWKPWSPERIQREDPQLYEILKSVLGDEAFTRG